MRLAALLVQSMVKVRSVPINLAQNLKRTLMMPSTAEVRGALIVFEGCDHSGKTTQCKKLVAALNEKGIKTEAMRFPGSLRRTSVCRFILKFLIM